MRGDWAVSTTFSYVLMFAVATMIFTGVMWSFSVSEEQAREEAMRQELTAIGEQVAQEVVDASLSGVENGSVESRLDLPRTVAGETYEIRFDESIGQVIVESSSGVEARVTLNAMESSVSFDGPIYSSSFSGSRQGLNLP